MKIYTGTGDSGQTSLFSGERVSKTNDRVETYGTIDELNACLGVVAASLSEKIPELNQEIINFQQILHQICAWMATSPESPLLNSLPEVSRKRILEIEQAIDRLGEKLPELEHFIIPGGHISAAYTHVARTVCRRAERQIIRLFEQHTKLTLVETCRNAQIFLNRLADYLFILGRYLNRYYEVAEIQWRNPNP